MRRYLVALFWIFFTTAAAAQPPAPGTFVVHAIDVGSGQSIFVEGADFTLLYDAGSSDDTPPGADNRVLAYIRAVRPELRCIDHVILSHAHLDHYNLMPDIFAAYEVANVWDPGARVSTAYYKRFLKSVASEAGATYHHAAEKRAADSAALPAQNCSDRSKRAAAKLRSRSVRITPGRVPLGRDAFMSVISGDGTLSDLHAGGLIVRLDLGARRILLPDDEAGRRAPPSSPPDPGSTEAKLIDCCAADIRADILVSPHHGSKSSSRTAFLDAVGASIYVVSAGPRVFAGLINPDSEVLREYVRRGSLWRTDINDYGCGRNPAKIGPDNDRRPGGCDNVRISIDRAGVITPAYSDRAD